jgi:O-antigen ligase
MSIAAIATAVLTLSLWLTSPRPRWPDTPVKWAWLAWAAALVLATVFALDPAGSVPRLKKALFPGLVALAAFHTADRRRGRRALGVLLTSSAVASVYGTAFFVGQGARFGERARGAVGHYMTYGGQLLIFIPVAAAVALLARDRRWKWGAGVASGLGLIALVGTFTRSAWLGVAASLATILGLTRPRWLIGLAVAIGILTVAAPASYRDRLASAFDPQHPMNLERTYMWMAGLEMFKDHPLTGVGLEDLHPVYERYRLPQAHESVGHLHSVPVMILATMGVVGVIAFLWYFGALFRCAATGLEPMLRSPDVEAGLRLGVLAALVGFAVAGLFEWNFGDEELLYPLVILAGMAWSARSAGEPDRMA